MEPKHLGALALILFGGYFLFKSLGILPGLGMFWPAVLIVLGLIALFQANSRPKRTVDDDGAVVYEVNAGSPLFKTLIAIPIAVTVLVIGAIMLGFLGPVFILSLVFIPIVLFFKIGWAFLRLLFPIVFGAAPLLLLLWILILLF